MKFRNQTGLSCAAVRSFPILDEAAAKEIVAAPDDSVAGAAISVGRNTTESSFAGYGCDL